MPRKKKAVAENQTELLDVTSKLRTAPCVPALREAVKAWVAGGYKGITDTTRILINHWFHTDHKLPTGGPFRYHRSQQEAIETLIFVWEFVKVRTRKGILQRYATDLQGVALPPYDDFARYAIKMATGSGKTKVMALAIAWQFLNAGAGRDCEGLRQDVPHHCTQRNRAGAVETGFRRRPHLPFRPSDPP
jgi:type III restriction enzyme